MTKGHKHREVRIDPSSRFGGWLVSLSRRPLPRWLGFHSTDLRRVDPSPYPYGMCHDTSHYDWSPEKTHACYYLSILSIAHRWTGLTWVYTAFPKED